MNNNIKLVDVAEACLLKDIITDVYPKGIVSIVSDTFNLWNVLKFALPFLKTEILARDGKVVIRPDSGDPVDIVCGNPNSENELEQKGVIEVLWGIFGGTITEQGYKLLDSHIGCIYGDAITIERCSAICERLKAKGFASTNMVFGIGSFTYQYNTRDTFGFALKSTHVVINGEEHNIYKDPATDKDKIKKSLVGRCIVEKDYVGRLCVKDSLDIQEQQNNSKTDLLEDVFVDGKLVRDESFANIRNRLLANL